MITTSPANTSRITRRALEQRCRQHYSQRCYILVDEWVSSRDNRPMASLCVRYHVGTHRGGSFYVCLEFVGTSRLDVLTKLSDCLDRLESTPRADRS